MAADTNLAYINTTARGIAAGTVPTQLLDAVPVLLQPEEPVPPNTALSQQPAPVTEPTPIFPFLADIKSIPIQPLTSVLTFPLPAPPSTGMQILGTNPQTPTSGSVGLDVATPSVAPIKTLNVRGYAISQIETYGYKSSQSGTLPQPFSTRPFFGWRPLVTVSFPRGFYDTNQTFPDGRVAIGPVHYQGSINLRYDGRMNPVKEDLRTVDHTNPSIVQGSTIAGQVNKTGLPPQQISPAIEPIPNPGPIGPEQPSVSAPETINPGVTVTPDRTTLGRADKSRFQIGVQMDLVPPGPITGRLMIGQPTAGYQYKIVGRLGTPLAYAQSTVPASDYGRFGSTFLLDNKGHVISGARLDSQKNRGFIQGPIISAPAIEQYDTHNYDPGYGNSP